VVRGLDTFRQHFAEHGDHYVLIGGVAASLVMEAAGLEFRATKDLDIVLVVEVLDAQFGRHLWQFIEDGGYEVRQTSEGVPRLYRFIKPARPEYPAMLELFSRQPDGIALAEGAVLTPIPIDEVVSSLSAILMDGEAYAFLLDGRIEIGGLRIVGADRLVPLKAAAWLDLEDRAGRGDRIDRRDVRKHLNDVLRLAQLLGGADRVRLPAGLAMRFTEFLRRAAQVSVNIESLKIAGGSQAEILELLRVVYESASVRDEAAVGA